MRNTITLNGISSDTITGLLIQELPAIVKPAMRTTIEEIDGRDGDIVTELGYSAYDKEITIGLYGSFDINAVIAYFATEGTVVFSNEPDKFYRYKIIDQIDYERLVRYRTATVKLHCQPFKYPTSETPVQLGSGQTVTAEGTDITMQGTALAPFVSITPKGDTSQQTYSGKNLLPNSAVGSTVKNDVTFTVDSTGRITVNGTANANTYFDLSTITLPAGDYVLSGLPSDGSGSSFKITFKFEGTQQNCFGVNGKSFSISASATATEHYLFIANGYHANNLVFEPMIETGQTKTSYEPYVGGTASPNPDYPQDVKVVTGEQTVKVTGKNLANYVPKTSAAQGLSSTYDSTTGEIHITGTATSAGWSDISQTVQEVLPAGTYTFSVINISGNFDKYVHFQIVGGSGHRCNVDSTTTFTTTADSSQIRFWLSTTSGKVYDATIKIQLELGSTATAYEPYQSQDYIIGLYGKNMFDGKLVNGSYYTTSVIPNRLYCTLPIRVKRGDTYTLSMTGDDGNLFRFALNASDIPLFSGSANTGVLGYDSGWSTSPITYTSDYDYVGIVVSRRDNGNLTPSDVSGCKFQLEASDQATVFEAYTPLELCKIGDYQDYIFKSGNDWYLHKEIKKIILNGSENWSSRTNSSGTLQMDVVATTDTPVGLSAASQYCNYARYRASAWNFGEVGEFSILNNTKHLLIGVPSTTTIEAWKAKIGANNLIAYFVLATPTNTKITNEALIEQLGALSNANSYRYVTKLTTTGDGYNLPVIIAATATGEADGTVTNAGNTYAKPKLTIYGTGNIGIYLNGNQMFQIELGSEGHITIDTEKMEVYKDSESNLKNRLVTGDYSKFRLEAGANQINFSGNINKCVVENYTRWL